MQDLSKRRDTSKTYWKVFFAIILILFAFFLLSDSFSPRQPQIQPRKMSAGFIFQRERINSSSEKYVLLRDANPVSYAEFLLQLESSSDFRLLLTRVLQAVDFPAYLFECPAVSMETMHTVNFAFVVTYSASLARAEVDDRPFRSHFVSCSEAVTSFMNLGGDARLVVPCPVSGVNYAAYTHLAQFMRYSPISQVDHLWRVVSIRVQEKLNSATNDDLWLSTNGNGVSWLHVRLDLYPKYYAYLPFKHPTRDGL